MKLHSIVIVNVHWLYEKNDEKIKLSTHRSVELVPLAELTA